jgi:hypothetical protein
MPNLAGVQRRCSSHQLNHPRNPLDQYELYERGVPEERTNGKSSKPVCYRPSKIDPEALQ